MLNKDLSSVLSGNISRYSLVIATAKRAREISDKHLENKEVTTEKPVSEALEQLLNNDYKIVEPDEIASI
ncbi:MAG: DNA-directed RNA polymerase subunit omega [Acutalibacteraceae bacterium]